MLEQLEELLSHLNAEDNEMALEFKAKLKQLQEKADRDALWRECLEAGGVDNWSGILNPCKSIGTPTIINLEPI